MKSTNYTHSNPDKGTFANRFEQAPGEWHVAVYRERINGQHDRLYTQVFVAEPGLARAEDRSEQAAREWIS